MLRFHCSFEINGNTHRYGEAASTPEQAAAMAVWRHDPMVTLTDRVRVVCTSKEGETLVDVEITHGPHYQGKVAEG